MLLFRRGDVSPAKERHCYAVTRKDTIASGMGDMWKGGRFPQDFTALSYRHAIGSQVVDEKRPARKGLTRLYAAKGCLKDEDIFVKAETAATVIVASGGYPEKYQKGFAIEDFGAPLTARNGAAFAETGAMMRRGLEMCVGRG